MRQKLSLAALSSGEKDNFIRHLDRTNRLAFWIAMTEASEINALAKQETISPAEVDAAANRLRERLFELMHWADAMRDAAISGGKSSLN